MKCLVFLAHLYFSVIKGLEAQPCQSRGIRPSRPADPMMEIVKLYERGLLFNQRSICCLNQVGNTLEILKSIY